MSESRTPTTTPSREEDYIRFKRYAAYAFLVASPIIIAIPPRKLDLYTFSLSTAFLLSANHITTERTGSGLVTHMGGFISRSKPNVFNTLPTERAQEVKKQLILAKEQERELAERHAAGNAEEEKGLRAIGKKVWMGGESEGWEKRRLEEERKALAEGKGYSDLIIDYVKDAWRIEKDDKKDGEGKGENN